MAQSTGKFRVLIPTTDGPVDVVRLTEQDAAIGRCAAYIGGTTETSDIAAAYQAFVVRPAGIIENLFGHSCYRIDVSGRINAGLSWQLAVLAAHALHAAGRLAGEGDAHDGVLWATGSVRAGALTIGSVSHVREKLESSIAGLESVAALGVQVVLAVPEANAADITAAQRAALAAQGIRVVTPARVHALFSTLSLALPAGPQPLPAAPSAALSAAPPMVVQSPPPPRHMGRILGAAIAALAGIAATGVYLFNRVSPPPDAQLAQQRTSSAPAALGTPTALVPELVPFISNRDQQTVRDVYLPAPDYKALALDSGLMAMITGQPSQAAANAAALEACQKKHDARPGFSPEPNACDLYASGNLVVSSRGHPPMPPRPWVVRDPSIERPFAAADVPLASNSGRRLAERYSAARPSKALVISPIGGVSEFFGNTNFEEASRRALERCGYLAGVACMILALDDVFIVPIPRSAKVTGFFRPEALTAVASDLRESVVRQLANPQSGWKALAIGANGKVGFGLGASSEQTAIDAAMAACGRLDRDCRVVVLGPFMVDRTAPGLVRGP